VAKGKCIAVELFPLWLEYYGARRWLNRPWKIIAIGAHWEYRELPYYVTPCLERNIWDRVEQLLRFDTINYSSIPEFCSGKEHISVFFHGHGERNIKGILGKIIDYVRNGIQMIRDGETIEELEKIFFAPASLHVMQLKNRLGRHQLLLNHLPWKQEITQLEQAVEVIGDFLKEPLKQGKPYDELLGQMDRCFDGISQLMKIHNICETW
jgi:hypothetical protein